MLSDSYLSLWAGWEGFLSDHYQNYHLSMCYVDKILLSSDLARVYVGAYSNFELTAKIKKHNLCIFICFLGYRKVIFPPLKNNTIICLAFSKKHYGFVKQDLIVTSQFSTSLSREISSAAWTIDTEAKCRHLKILNL
jgi:hypothetical protein